MNKNIAKNPGRPPSWLLGFICGITFPSILFVFSIDSLTSKQKVQHFMSQKEVQSYLVEQGYNITIDGKVGPETRSAWNDYIEHYDSLSHSDSFQ